MTRIHRLKSNLGKPEQKFSMNRRMCRQVLDCGDGVREVTALAVKLLKIAKRAADTATTTQSGDSEDSVAAVQDAGSTNPPPCGSCSDARSQEHGSRLL